VCETQTLLKTHPYNEECCRLDRPEDGRPQLQVRYQQPDRDWRYGRSAPDQRNLTRQVLEARRILALVAGDSRL
jgi:hypothetical protein